MPIAEPMNLPVKRKAGMYYEAVTLAMLRLRQLLLENWWQGRIKLGLTDRLDRRSARHRRLCRRQENVRQTANPCAAEGTGNIEALLTCDRPNEESKGRQVRGAERDRRVQESEGGGVQEVRARGELRHSRRIRHRARKSCCATMQ